MPTPHSHPHSRFITYMLSRTYLRNYNEAFVTYMHVLICSHTLSYLCKLRMVSHKVVYCYVILLVGRKLHSQTNTASTLHTATLSRVAIRRNINHPLPQLLNL